ncbi:uncharacterized protein BT62DRAFT_773311 [Guyanagaster necrorhizus]|uniref:Uncharacterized protein n=1 Tax=Guyanagaster necrorhizus TaxID=856835 RepID=A0A9P8ALU8_9AGAR|nr:uncharacterized protein BT62DRAFT_773311 [Guyanagaster necrorhizus MCA 3950]KAG7439207.1 hypothetical protein BT62DRAFT_773311 [Guyanagaster necrorhizus MCA 3950]
MASRLVDIGKSLFLLYGEVWFTTSSLDQVLVTKRHRLIAQDLRAVQDDVVAIHKVLNCQLLGCHLHGIEVIRSNVDDDLRSHRVFV